MRTYKEWLGAGFDKFTTVQMMDAGNNLDKVPFEFDEWFSFYNETISWSKTLLARIAVKGMILSAKTVNHWEQVKIRAQVLDLDHLVEKAEAKISELSTK